MEKFDEPWDFLGFSQDLQTSYENIICRLTFFLTFSFAPVGLCLHRPLWCCCLDTQIWRGGCTVHRHLSSQCSGAWSCIQSWVVIQQELPLYRQHETDLSAAVSASVLNVSQPFVSKNWMSNQMKLGARTWHQTSPVLLFKNQRSRRSPTQWGAAWRFSLSLSSARFWASNHWVNSVKLTVSSDDDSLTCTPKRPVTPIPTSRMRPQSSWVPRCRCGVVVLTMGVFETTAPYPCFFWPSCSLSCSQHIFFSYLWKCVVNPRFLFFFDPWSMACRCSAEPPALVQEVSQHVSQLLDCFFNGRRKPWIKVQESLNSS